MPAWEHECIAGSPLDTSTNPSLDGALGKHAAWHEARDVHSTTRAPDHTPCQRIVYNSSLQALRGTASISFSPSPRSQYPLKLTPAALCTGQGVSHTRDCERGWPAGAPGPCSRMAPPLARTPQPLPPADQGKNRARYWCQRAAANMQVGASPAAAAGRGRVALVAFKQHSSGQHKGPKGRQRPFRAQHWPTAASALPACQPLPQAPLLHPAAAPLCPP
jgi:hypothetical protein